MDFEQQLRAAFAPCDPRPELRSSILARRSDLRGSPAGRTGSRTILFGTILAVAAAAAMLAMRLLEPAASTVAVDSALVPAAPPIDARDAPVSPDTSATDAVPTVEEGEPQPAVPAVPPFTVQMLPLKSDVDDPPRKTAIETVYATFVDGLRAVPGLTLVEPARSGSEARALPNFILTLEGSALPASAGAKDDFFVGMVAKLSGSDGRMAGEIHTGMGGKIAPGCASPASMDVLASTSSCADPVDVAGGLLAMLRKSVFPPDPQLQWRLQARLVDQALNAEVRLGALLDLQSLGKASVTSGRDEFPPNLRDPAVVRAAIQLAAVTSDPAARAQVWYTLRGSGDPVLLRPLTMALGTDPDDDTRVQALTTLTADFATDPQAHAALETASVRDLNPMVRALAQRALGGESGWTEYVLASLKDTGRSPTKRVEALFYAYGLPTSHMYGSFSADGRILRALDDAAMRALTEALPRAATESQGYARASLTLVRELTDMNHPAITDMLLDGLDAGSAWLDRSMAVEALHRRADDPRVRAALEKIAAEDTDPKLRELAGMPLSTSQKTIAATAGPSRLGVMTEYLEAAPDVPADQVGKLSVTRMATDSVAERAGMKEADVLLQVGGKPITSGPQLIEVLDALPRDVDVDVLVSRNGQIMRLTARF